MSKNFLLLIQAALLLVAASGHASDEGGQVHYCNDPTVDADWERIIANSDVPEPRQLNNLRLRLCDRVRAGEIPVDAAIRQFERARDRAVKKMNERFKREQFLNPEQMG